MNKVLQGVLLLDTETSLALKKGGKINIVVEGSMVEVEFNKENKCIKNFTIDNLEQELEYIVKPKDTIIIQEETYKQLLEGKVLPHGRGTIRIEEGKLLYSNSKQPVIHQVIFR